ncbi:VrrA/YqfQ family protein [Terribacillus saccharophilus]|uniref:VrrA/YqfQ family protein n=1 Tax=Terribacillus saccharophilus TaxID=361277 RepID=UPI0039819F86
MARNPLGPSMFGRRGQPPVRRDPFYPARGSFQQQAPRQSGGLPGILQKILNRGGRGRSVQAAAKAALPASSSPTGKFSLLDMLNHTQNALKAAESFMPMVQEYGPMVKNLPSMLRMMKALKDIDFDEEEDAVPEKEEEVKEKNEQEKEQAPRTHVEEEKASDQHEKQRKSGESLPKLFI